ncbi:MAG TPA: hypothetical protein VIM42_09130 [Clostridium sp.]
MKIVSEDEQEELRQILKDRSMISKKINLHILEMAMLDKENALLKKRFFEIMQIDI